MFAVIRTGGKQYKVKIDDIIKIEKIDTEKGGFVSLDHVLLVNDGKKSTLGSPEIKGATVQVEVLDHVKNEKIIVFKKKRRQNYRRKKGHRQIQTVVKVSGIYTDGKAPSLSEAEKKATTKKSDTAKKAKATKKTVEKKVEPQKTVEKKTSVKKAVTPKKETKKTAEKKAPAKKKTETKKKVTDSKKS